MLNKSEPSDRGDSGGFIGVSPISYPDPGGRGHGQGAVPTSVPEYLRAVY